MRDIILEISETIRRNKLRTCLTGFAVAWGIFMLIVLLGAGNGLVNSFHQGSGEFASNTMQVGAGVTSKPYGGFQSGRMLALEDKDIDLTKSQIFADKIDKVTATVGTNVTVSVGRKHFSGYIEGNYPERLQMEKIEIVKGRFIDDDDIRTSRKVLVLPQNVAENLVEQKSQALDLVGRQIKVGNLSFTVAGISKSDEMRNDNLFYAPFTTIKEVYSKGKNIDDLTFTFHGLKTERDNEAFEKTYKAAVNLRHGAAPDDDSATWLWNRFTQNMQMDKAGSIINIALWIIGLFTLLSGVVGVSNIMLITVKERTHEFGIRKAIGATPGSITKLIISESIAITAFFGYIGMILGLIACEVLDKTLGQTTMSVMDQNISLLINPTVGIDVAIEATLVLILAGVLAGFFPARRAANVRPIEALSEQ